jgi:hypothetical protein
MLNGTCHREIIPQQGQARDLEAVFGGPIGRQGLLYGSAGRQPLPQVHCYAQLILSILVAGDQLGQEPLYVLMDDRATLVGSKYKKLFLVLNEPCPVIQIVSLLEHRDIRQELELLGAHPTVIDLDPFGVTARALWASDGYVSIVLIVDAHEFRLSSCAGATIHWFVATPRTHFIERIVGNKILLDDAELREARLDVRLPWCHSGLANAQLMGQIRDGKLRMAIVYNPVDLPLTRFAEGWLTIRTRTLSDRVREHWLRVRHTGIKDGSLAAREPPNVALKHFEVHALLVHSITRVHDGINANCGEMKPIEASHGMFDALTVTYREVQEHDAVIVLNVKSRAVIILSGHKDDGLFIIPRAARVEAFLEIISTEASDKRLAPVVDAAVLNEIVAWVLVITPHALDARIGEWLEVSETYALIGDLLIECIGTQRCLRHLLEHLGHREAWHTNGWNLRGRHKTIISRYEQRQRHRNSFRRNRYPND